MLEEEHTERGVKGDVAMPGVAPTTPESPTPSEAGMNKKDAQDLDAEEEDYWNIKDSVGAGRLCTEDAMLPKEGQVR